MLGCDNISDIRLKVPPYLSHELFGGEDQLVVDHPTWLFLEEWAVGMDENSLLVFDCFISPFTQACRVVEISRSHRLEENHIYIITWWSCSFYSALE